MLPVVLKAPKIYIWKTCSRDHNPVTQDNPQISLCKGEKYTVHKKQGWLFWDYIRRQRIYNRAFEGPKANFVFSSASFLLLLLDYEIASRQTNTIFSCRICLNNLRSTPKFTAGLAQDLAASKSFYHTILIFVDAVASAGCITSICRSVSRCMLGFFYWLKNGFSLKGPKTHDDSWVNHAHSVWAHESEETAHQSEPTSTKIWNKWMRATYIFDPFDWQAFYILSRVFFPLLFLILVQLDRARAP